MAVEMSEEQAYKKFRKMVELLCASGSHVVDKTEPEGAPVPVPVLLPESMPDPEPEPGEYESEEVESESQDEPAISSYSIGYGGFLYIKCPDCEKVKGFCAKTRLSNFRCDCGSVTKLDHLVPLYMHCECGRNSRYLTNMEEPAFDIICYDCGNPVAVAWNPKKKQYETIRN